MKPSETKIKDDPKPKSYPRAGLQSLASNSSIKQSIEKRTTGLTSLSALRTLIMPASISRDLDAFKSKRIDVKAIKNVITNDKGLVLLLGKQESLHNAATLIHKICRQSTEKLE
jgi:hypothetical protein